MPPLLRKEPPTRERKGEGQCFEGFRHIKDQTCMQGKQSNSKKEGIKGGQRSTSSRGTKRRSIGANRQRNKVTQPAHGGVWIAISSLISRGRRTRMVQQGAMAICP